jgi:hypothetical protein
MDFIEGLPASSGFSVILVVVDRFIKYSHFFRIQHPYTTSSIAQVFLNNAVKLHRFLRPLYVTVTEFLPALSEHNCSNY